MSAPPPSTPAADDLDARVDELLRQVDTAADQFERRLDGVPDYPPETLDADAIPEPPSDEADLEAAVNEALEQAAATAAHESGSAPAPATASLGSTPESDAAADAGPPAAPGAAPPIGGSDDWGQFVSAETVLGAVPAPAPAEPPAPADTQPPAAPVAASLPDDATPATPERSGASAATDPTGDDAEPDTSSVRAADEVDSAAGVAESARADADRELERTALLEPATPTPADVDLPAEPEPAPVRTPGVLHRAAARALTPVFAPLENLPATTRQTIGWLAIVTAFSAVCLWIFIHLRPVPTAQDVARALEAAERAAVQKAEENARTAADDGHGAKSDGHGAKSDGHGAPKKDAHGAAKKDAHGAPKKNAHAGGH